MLTLPLTQHRLDKLILLEHSIGTLLAGHFVEGLHAVGLHTGTVDEEGHGVGSVCTVRARCLWSAREG